MANIYTNTLLTSVSRGFIIINVDKNLIMNLERYQQDGLELYIDKVSGESYASQSSLARMCGVSDSTILRWRTSANIVAKNAEVPTTTGLKTSALYDEKAIREAFKKYAPELYDKCTEAGVRVFLHKLAGYEVTSTAVNNKMTNSQPSELEVLEFCLNPLKEYVDKALVDGVRLNYAERKYPELKDELNEMRSLIAGSNKIDTVLLTPTKVGKYLQDRLNVKYSAKIVNQLLIDNGYQILNPNKTSKDDPKYIPTEKGLEFSNMSLATGKVGDCTSYQHLKWLESVVDELENIVKV